MILNLGQVGPIILDMGENIRPPEISDIFFRGSLLQDMALLNEGSCPSSSY